MADSPSIPECTSSCGRVNPRADRSWRGYEPGRGAPEHASREAVAAWCRERGIRTKGHPLVWNHPASVPGWLPGGSEATRALSEARVADCVEQFEGLIDTWDVVNEATDPWRFDGENPMTRAMRELGILDWTRRSFVAARRRNADACLLINDYRTDPAYVDLIGELERDGAPLYDAIGIQSHMHGGVWRPSRTWEVCDRFAAFGVPLHFTETTIVSGRRTGREWGPSEPALEEMQAREAARFYTVLFSHPAVEAVTWWDFADRRAWQGAPAGMLRHDLTPKPIYRHLLALVRDRWWTEVDLLTDERGEARVRAFYGHYQIEALGKLTGALRHEHPRAEGRSEARLVVRH